MGGGGNVISGLARLISRSYFPDGHFTATCLDVLENDSLRVCRSYHLAGHTVSEIISFAGSDWEDLGLR